MNVVFSVFLFSQTQYIGGVLFLIAAGIGIYVWFSWKERIPLATLMLKNVAKFTQRYPGTTFVGFIFMFASILYVAIWSFTVSGYMLL
ncbi:hypothetical protein DSO57_1032548 [Entomophthora muscae]|uniref:Uncharacterized protein n=1 Tax=Entomophthora muscae TaxID=34485 RepID=A0ACC2RF11_9FUNG|nr:hypothetical protein DSO57_1032548 [Entomophthora muscae]